VVGAGRFYLVTGGFWRIVVPAVWSGINPLVPRS
jgi:hypothetical protein